MASGDTAKPQRVVMAGTVAAGSFLLLSILVSGLASDVAETITVAVILGMTAWVTRLVHCTALVRRIVAIALCSFAFGQVVDLSGSITAFDAVPVIGSEAPVRDLLETLGFSFGIIFLFWALLFALLEVQEGREADQRYRLLADNVSDVISTIDLDLQLTYVSPSVYGVRGLRPEEALQQRPEDIFTPGSLVKARALLQSELERVVRGERPLNEGVTVELELIHKNGSNIPVETRVSPLLDAHGEIGGLLAVTRDISERKRAEEVLRQSESRLRTLVENAPVCIHEVDLDGRICSMNPTGLAMLGLDCQDAVLGTHYLEFVLPEDKEMVAAQLKRAMAGEAVRFEREAEYAGEILNIRSDIVPLRDESNRVVRLMGMTTDQTRETQANAERERLLAQLNQAQKMESVGRLAGGVAHDFNNMLGVVLGHVELLIDRGELQQTDRDHLLEIQSFCKRASDLTRQLLAFSRQQTVAPHVLNLNEATAKMRTMLQRLIGENLALRWNPADDLWPVLIDPAQVDQVLANLCVNARDAIEESGEISIVTENVTVEDDRLLPYPGFKAGDYVRLVIADSGRGMDSETLEKAFDPFYTTKDLGKGTGLGLSTVYGIVKQNGGYIDMKSRTGEGTTVALYFPRHQGPVPTAVEERRASPAKPDKGSETILLVEDEGALLRATEAMLRRLGYEVIAAASPVEAIDHYNGRQEEIALVLTDVVMPEMNGRALIDELEVRNPSLRTLYMSGYAGDLFGENGILEEGVNFIQKPFSLKVLAAKVREVLDCPGKESVV